MKKGKMSIVIGGQAGSEAKGKLSGWLCDMHSPDLLVMAASPNAGHTIITPIGEKKVSYHLPIGMVMCDCPVCLGPSSLVNLDILEKEIHDLGIDPCRIYLDPRASIITEENIGAEKAGHLESIGSTLQGIGECRMTKIRRKRPVLASDYMADLLRAGINVVRTSPIINDVLDQGKVVLCEATQGFDLDLEHGIDPIYCTSKMINPAMAMAEAGVSPNRVGDIYGVIRPYPIRVNNRTGSSGHYAGAGEITWEEVAKRCGYPKDYRELAELTTTTKLLRRVFEFPWKRFNLFLQVCRPDYICLQFANYIDWRAYKVRSWGKLPRSVANFIRKLEECGSMVKYIGTGPGHEDMIEDPRTREDKHGHIR